MGPRRPNTPQPHFGRISLSTHLAEGVQADPVVQKEAPHFLNELSLTQGHPDGHTALSLLGI